MVVRLKDIAGELGVSVPLVSKVLNNSQGTIGVSEKTAQLIRETAKRMGYVRNRSAASLTQGRQNAFALLMHFTGVPGSRNNEDILEGVSANARKYDQHLELAFYSNDEDFAAALERLNSSSIDGLILAGAAHPNLLPRIIQTLDAGMPVITMFPYSLHERLINVACDQEEMGRLAASHLIERGCERIACISMSEDRLEGYKRALCQAGRPVEPELVVSIVDRDAVRLESGIIATETLIKRGVQFDGLVAQSDLHAAAAMHALKDAGLRIPEQVKVVGMDNSVLARDAKPTMTSVSESLGQQAQAAVDLLMDAVAGKHIDPVTVSPCVHQRESS